MSTFAIYTSGCRLNQADSALLADSLHQHGFRAVTWGIPADILIINSCAVTAVASQKTRQLVHATRRRAPSAFIILLGCDVVADGERWAQNPDIDLLISNPKPDSLYDLLPVPLLRSPAPAQRWLKQSPLQEDFTISGTGYYPERTRANLKIQEGCDFFCSYCIVPYTRGRARSRNLDDILREADILLQRGHKELVLSGVNIACYQNNNSDLPDLLCKLLTLGSDFRIRLGSTEPGQCLDRLIDVIAENPQICRFLHLPVQYGEDTILQRMKRHYDIKTYESTVMRALEAIPGLCLGTDIIVGFPGETEDTFQRCRAFLERIPFGLLHVFPYSPRPGTPAASFPERPKTALARQRAAELRALGESKAELFAASQLGKILPVLLETSSPKATGWSDNYLKVQISSSQKLQANTLIQAQITSCKAKRQLGAILPDKH